MTISTPPFRFDQVGAWSRTQAGDRRDGAAYTRAFANSPLPVESIPGFFKSFHARAAKHREPADCGNVASLSVFGGGEIMLPERVS
jgi:hypothetical protein